VRHGAEGDALTGLARWLCIGWVPCALLAACGYLVALYRGAFASWTPALRGLLPLGLLATLPLLLSATERLVHALHDEARLRCDGRLRCAIEPEPGRAERSPKRYADAVTELARASRKTRAAWIDLAGASRETPAPLELPSPPTTAAPPQAKASGSPETVVASASAAGAAPSEAPRAPTPVPVPVPIVPAQAAAGVAVPWTPSTPEAPPDEAADVTVPWTPSTPEAPPADAADGALVPAAIRLDAPGEAHAPRATDVDPARVATTETDAVTADADAAASDAPGETEASPPPRPAEGPVGIAEDGDRIRSGPWVERAPDGQKLAEGRYENGLREGFWREWYPDGTPKLNATYRAGAPQGDLRSFHPNGELERSRKELTTEDGLVLWVESRFDAGGHRIERRQYENGTLQGPQRTWDAAGTLRSAGTYSGGKKHGSWMYWSEGGETRREVWDHGRRLLPPARHDDR
jgi:hypothetical protein